MDVVVMLTEFKKYLKARGYAESTIECYSGYLKFFKRWLQKRRVADLKKVTHGMISDYQAEVMSLPLALESKALRIRPI